MKCYNRSFYSKIRFKPFIVSIELPKYTISSEQQKSKKNNPFILLLVAIIVFILGYFMNSFRTSNTLKILQERNNVLENQNSTQQDIIEQQKTELSLLLTEKKIKKEATHQLQQDYKIRLQEVNQLKSELSFYERLLSPKAGNKGLRVFEISLTQNSEGNYFLKAILVQKLERAREIAGSYSIEIIGIKNNKPATIPVSVKDNSKFKFKYFYNISFNFSLPEGFKPQQLVVKLYPKVKKAKTIEHLVEWSTLTQ